MVYLPVLSILINDRGVSVDWKNAVYNLGPGKRDREHTGFRERLGVRHTQGLPFEKNCDRT